MGSLRFGSIAITYQIPAGVVYELEASTDLAQWVDVTDVSLEVGVNQATIAAESSARMFLRNAENEEQKPGHLRARWQLKRKL